jgi:hypothetical protein
MSFQTIFEISQSISVQNRRTVGQQVSRSGQVRVAEYLTSVPWSFTVRPHAYLYYPQVRSVIQVIDNKDRQLPETITFSSSLLNWFTSYQGDLVQAQVAAMTIGAYSNNGTQITLGNLPNGTSTQLVFKAGDFLQIGVYSYKVTSDVPLGSNSPHPGNASITFNLHRPIIGTPTIGNALTAVGSDCTFYLLAAQCPTYTLNPMTSGAFVEWDGDFVFIEDITG